MCAICPSIRRNSRRNRATVTRSLSSIPRFSYTCAPPARSSEPLRIRHSPWPVTPARRNLGIPPDRRCSRARRSTGRHAYPRMHQASSKGWCQPIPRHCHDGPAPGRSVSGGGIIALPHRLRQFESFVLDDATESSARTPRGSGRSRDGRSYSPYRGPRSPRLPRVSPGGHSGQSSPS